MQTETIKRLRLETSETGAAEATRRLKTLAEEAGGLERSYASLARSYEVMARQQATTVESSNKVAGAFREMGSAIKDHPLLVAAGVTASARALGALSPALMTASVATKALANDNAILAAGAGVTARALAAGASATATASASAAKFAESLSPAVAATRLLSTAAGVALPVLAPLAAGLLAIKVGADVLDKASTDLARLVEIGKKAEALDISAPFLKSVTGIGKQLRVEVADMEAGLAKASELVRDRFGQPNQLGAHLSSLYTQGYGAGGGQQFQASRLLDVATTTEEKIRAGIVGMTELEALGQKFAVIDLAEKLFPQAVVDRLRTGQTTAAQILADLDAARAKEVLSQEDVNRAVELSRNIEATKREIRDAWAVSVDFSAAAAAIDTAWLGILRTVRDVSVGINDGMGGALAGVQAQMKALGDYAERLGNASIWTKAYNALPKLPGNGGVENAPPGGFQELGPPIPAGYQPPIGYRNTPEMFGPNLSEMSTPTAAKAAAPAGPSQDTLSGMDRYLIDLDKARDLAKAEYDTIGLGNAARERALDIAKARAAAERDFERGLRDSAALTEAETDRINAAADATAKWKDQAKELQDALTFTSDATKDFAKTFVGDMRQGKSAIEALTDALDKLSAKLLDKSLDMAIDSLFKGSGSGAGGLNGILASLLSGRGSSGLDVLPSVPGISGASFAGPSGFAIGGPVRGAGTGTSDSIAARLSNGEFVINAQATSRHLDLLHAINDNRSPRGFADGGLVGAWPMETLPRGPVGSAAPVLNFNVQAHGADVDQPKVTPGPGGSWNVDMTVRSMRRSMDGDRAAVGQAGPGSRRG